MKVFKEILGRILALWGILMFALTMILFLFPFFAFCYFQKDPIKTKRFVICVRYWMSTFFMLVGCSLEVTGKENFKPGETYIVVCNHNSFFDIMIAFPRIPGGNKTIGKIELSRMPIFNLIYNSGAVLVDRKNEVSRRESFNKMKAVLDMGLHMCIYPEGTRNRTNEALKSFHNGAFKLAMDTGRPIIPAVIFNTKKVLPVNKAFFLWPQKMSMVFLPPVDPQSAADADSLKTKVFEIMKNYYETGVSENGVK
jgi:1-acyl-sn-glycerol-3-phosphate acyltransferase